MSTVSLQNLNSVQSNTLMSTSTPPQAGRTSDSDLWRLVDALETISASSLRKAASVSGVML